MFYCAMYGLGVLAKTFEILSPHVVRFRLSFAQMQIRATFLKPKFRFRGPKTDVHLRAHPNVGVRPPRYN